jgi:hypothetical protein
VFYSGSISPPREPPKKKFVVPQWRCLAAEMGEKEVGSSSSSASGVRESSLMWPMLTRSNYTEWAMLMQCNYEAMEVWEVIEPRGDGVKRLQDRLAMGCLLRSVPKEMWQMLGSKRTVKDAWAAVKSMRVGAEHVKEVNAQCILKEFENIAFCDGESVDDFAMRINALAADLRTIWGGDRRYPSREKDVARATPTLRPDRDLDRNLTRSEDPDDRGAGRPSPDG